MANRKRINENRRKRQSKWVKAGLCSQCGNIREDSDFLTCRPCRSNGKAKYNPQYHRNYQRNFMLGTLSNGKKVNIRVNKRVYPKDKRCEIGEEISKRLVYHHWDNLDLSKGIWVCLNHHRFAEDVDKGLVQRYLDLKRSLNEKAKPEIGG